MNIKNLLLLLSVPGAVLAADAQSKLNGNATLLVNEVKSELTSGEALGLKSSEAPASAQFYILVSNVEDASKAIKEAGGKVLDVIDNIVIAEIPVAEVESVAANEAIQYVELAPELKLDLNYARPDGKVTEAQSGFEYNGATHSFTGKGVVAGLLDQGLDPGHINFRDQATGQSRVKVLYHYSKDNGNPTAYTTPAAIAQFTTDGTSTSHGTHVLGIMAGSYNGAGNYAYVSSATGSRVTQTEGNIPYYGVATDADLAVCCGVLAQTNVTSSLKNIFDYANSAGKPAVANLSLGNNGGPHDGTELYTQTLSSLAKRGIVCISAGNEGDVAMYVNYKFTDTNKEMKTFIVNNKATGTVEVWGNDATPFKLSWALYAKSGGSITKFITLDAAGQTGTATTSNDFKTYFQGSISAVSGVNNLNNRYNVVSSLSVTQIKTGMDLALIVEGTNGQEIYIYGNNPSGSAPTFTANRLSGWTEGQCDGSINSLACAKGLISIGSYNSRLTWGQLNANYAYAYNNQQSGLGEISDFSSWGQTFQGQWLPYVCAPGSAIISSFNTYSVNASNSGNEATAKVTEGRNNYYWGAMQGTSMSSPYAAGVIALWLQADPTLTADDVIDIIKTTSVAATSRNKIPGIGSGTTTANERWGAGKIDAVAGLKEVLKRTGAVGSIIADDKGIIINPVAGGYNVFMAGENGFTAELVDLGGRTVASATSVGDELTVSTDAVAPGVYILNVTGANSYKAQKVSVR